MPQGSFKNKNAGKVPGKKNKPKKDALKKKPGNSAKKKNALESKKLKVQLEKAINAKIEEDIKAKASNTETSFKILKSSAGAVSKKKK